jgi:isoaspartyl peptidase/L-asparaginase-like protein (Ntn-hydrolase superfamily)
MDAQARTLVSSGAYDFASNSGVITVPPDAMVSSRAQKEWRFWSERVNNSITKDNDHPLPSGNRTLMQDTVGAVALDTTGSLASGVSRSVNQLLHKFPA